jgi:molecular chaperone GrpE
MTDNQQSEERATPARPDGGQMEPAEHRVAVLEAERRELYDRLHRLAGECDSWKKRAWCEQSEAEGRTQKTILFNMLEVVDGLERALAGLDENASVEAVREGLGLVLRSLLRKLEGYGIRPVDAIGERFDPRRHDAIARAPSRDVEPGTVLSEVQKGYTMKDHPLRPAAVVVAESGDPPARAAH